MIAPLLLLTVFLSNSIKPASIYRNIRRSLSFTIPIPGEDGYAVGGYHETAHSRLLPNPIAFIDVNMPSVIENNFTAVVFAFIAD